MGKMKKELEANPVAEETNTKEYKLMKPENVVYTEDKQEVPIELNDLLYGVRLANNQGWYEAFRVPANIQAGIIGKAERIGEPDIKAVAVERCRMELDRILDT